MSKKVTGESPSKKTTKAPAQSKKKAARKAPSVVGKTAKPAAASKSKPRKAAPKKSASKKKAASKVLKTPTPATSMAAVAPMATSKALQKIGRSELVKRPSEEEIRQLAYEISRRRTGPADPVADWFLAEQELSAQGAHRG